MFQEFGAKALTLDQQQPAAPTPRDEAAALIRRYPKLAETELAQLINLYRGFSALDMALILSDEKLSTNLDRFSADHRSKIRTPFRQYAALVGYAIVAVAALAWTIAVVP